MKGKSVNVNIDTGGKVRVFNDPPQEPNWRRKERAMTERARNYFPNPRESALERELWNQVSGGNLSAFPTTVNPKLAADYSAYQSRLNREDQINRQLFDQINAR